MGLEDSNFLREYLSFKKDNPDYILLFQIGDFFEVLYEDAGLFSELTGVALSSRNAKGKGEIPQAGIPKKALNIYIKKLLDCDCKVALCLQFKDDNGKCYRKIVRKFTKGTLVENEFLESSENNHILALLFDEKTKQINLSYSDVSIGQVFKTVISIQDLNPELAKIAPNEVLVLDNQDNFFKNLLNNYNITILKADSYSNLSTDKIIEKYCKNTQMGYCVELSESKQYTCSKYMMMDQITRSCLELTRTRRLLKKKGSLLWFLNHTKTPMGIRLLKKYIDEPLLEIDLIRQRYSAISELIEKQGIELFQDLFENFCDLSRITARISNSTIMPNDLLKIAQNTLKLQELSRLCDKFDSKLLKFDCERLHNVINFAIEISNAIEENSANDIKSGSIIKSAYNSNLDYLRLNLNQLYEKVSDFELNQKKKLKIDKLKVDYSRVIGYYIEVPISKKTSVTNDYVQKQVLSSCVRFSTDELKELEEEIYNLKFKINELEYELFCNLRKYALKFVFDIRELAKNIAQLDVLVSFAKCAVINNFVKPDFNNSKIDIKDGYHPSLLKLKNEVIKNDTLLNNETMIILTGANMSGKSTYLKQNAIISLLAQIGSFVPAQKADLVLIDKLFIRQGSTDDIVNNNSTFMVEMNDLKYIIENTTKDSYILLDEPAKSTNSQEGGAIARAFLEYILKYFKTKTIVATHNAELTKMEEDYKNRVFNYVIGNQTNDDYNLANRKIKRGKISSSFALNTALLANLPDELIENAKKYIK